MALPKHKAHEIAQSCGSEYEILAAGVARLLVASPDPSAWTHTGLTGACVFIFNQTADHHLLRMYALERHDLLWEFEVYEDFKMQFLTDRLLAFEVDDFVMGLAFSLTADAEEFFSAVQDEAPRSADSLQLVMFRDLENKQRQQKGGGLTRLFGWRKDREGSSSKTRVDASALEGALQSAQGVEIVLNADGSIDVASLSPALRAVFKQAGVRKRDLRHRSTAAMLLAVLQEVGAEISDAPQPTTAAPARAPPSLAAFTILEETEEQDEDETEEGGVERREQQAEEAPLTASTMSTTAVRAPAALQAPTLRSPPAPAPQAAGSAASSPAAAAASPSPRTRTKRSSMAAFASPALPSPAASPSPAPGGGAAGMTGSSASPPSVSAASPGASSASPMSPRTRRMSRRMVSAVHSAAASRQHTMAPLREEGGVGGGSPEQDDDEGAARGTSSVRPSLQGAIAAAAKARQERPAAPQGRGAQSLPVGSARGPQLSLLDQIKAKGNKKGGLRHVRRPTDARKSIVAKFAKQPAAGPGLLGQLQANLAHRRMFLKEESSDEEDSDSDWSD